MDTQFDQILKLSGKERLDIDYQDIVLREQRGESRFLKEARGKSTAGFLEALQTLYDRETTSWDCIAPRYRCAKLADILFRVASKAAGAVFLFICICPMHGTLANSFS